MLLFINMIIHIGNSPLVSLPAPDLLPLEQMKMNNKKNEIESRLKNNNYINSSNQTWLELGMNPFYPKTNSFLDRTFYYYIFTSIQEGIRL